uniref:Chromosome 6 open reading frame 163 n=1 Tax=Sphenodon punctatus TaxID=8508 RepID=A0A8D0G080_SPHPU
MAHRIQRVVMECELEKMKAVAEAREEERRAAAKALAALQTKHVAQLQVTGAMANKEYQKSLNKLSIDKEYEMNIAFGITQKETLEETLKQLEEAEKTHQTKLEEVTTKVKEKETQMEFTNQKLESMTAWKDRLEEEIQEIRQAFQKYIEITFPQLSSGQADFILPSRKKFENEDTKNEG